jgi:hypothetical protein
MIRGRIHKARGALIAASFAGCLAAYAWYGAASSDSPWHEVLFTLLMRFEPPWFDIGDSAARVASALAFWACAATCVVLVAYALMVEGQHASKTRAGT